MQLPSWVRDFRPSDNPDFNVATPGDDKGFVGLQLGDTGFPVYVGAGGDPPMYTDTTHGRSYFNDWWVNHTFEGSPRYQATTIDFGFDSSTSTISWTSDGYWPAVRCFLLCFLLFLSAISGRCFLFEGPVQRLMS